METNGRSKNDILICGPLAAKAAAFFICVALTCGPAVYAQTKPVPVEQFGSDKSLPRLILLHGVGGPSDFYRGQARFFADHGYHVFMPHYMDARRGQNGSDANYDAWTAAVRQTLNSLPSSSQSATVMVGYSLGASVALALGSQGEGPDAIAEFYGSLPDKYYEALKGMPPLLILHGERDDNIPVANALQLSRLCKEAELACQVHLFPREGHGFTPQTLQQADELVLQFFEPLLHPSPTPASR